MMPSCDHTGVPGLVGLTHFHSSTTSGSAFLMSVRILLRVSPRQSPSSAILFEMSSDADWPWLASDFFMFLILEVPDVLGTKSPSFGERAHPCVVYALRQRLYRDGTGLCGEAPPIVGIAGEDHGVTELRRWRRRSRCPDLVV